MSPVVVKSSFVPFSVEQLLDLEARFGPVRVVTAARPKRQRHHTTDPEPPWEIVIRSPTQGESDAFEGAANNDRAKAGALRELARKTVVAISHWGAVTIHDGERGKLSKVLGEAWEKLRHDFPGVHIAAQSDLMALNGAEADESGKE
jgi:hypothetical protein